jgi:SAM-dependent methyltransferase
MTILTPNTSTTSSTENPQQPAPASSKSYSYSDTFYRYIQAGSVRSASHVVPLVLRELSPQSVLDVGCGAGAWLSVYGNLGVADYLGVDGAYVQPESLLIPVQCFQPQDITQEFDLERRFDVVQCLEVGEHLPGRFSSTLVDNLVRHGDRIVFSAATPGQGGENHINEQTHEFWRQLFASHGYKPFDLFRPMIKGIPAVESWYRRNIVLYVKETALPALPAAVLPSAIRDGQAIPQMASIFYRMRASILTFLPAWCVSKIALAKHRLVIASRSLRRSK